MRELQFQTRTTHAIKSMTSAIAWATNRRGRITWKEANGNVSDVIVRYLDEHKVKMPDEYHGHTAGSRVTYTLRRIAKEGLGKIETNGQGRITLFKFDDDVNLNGHSPELLTTSQSLPKNIVEAATNVQYDQAGSEGFLNVPLPPAPVPPRYKAEEVTRLLDKWADHDADGYAAWAESVIERLEALYG